MEENSRMLECNALTGICTEINFCIISLTSSNNERKMKEKLKQEMKISEKYDFYDDWTDQAQVLNLSPKYQTKILDKKKEYVEPTLQAASQIEEQTKIDKQNFLEVELEQNKINIGIEKDRNIAEITDIFDKIKTNQR